MASGKANLPALQTYCRFAVLEQDSSNEEAVQDKSNTEKKSNASKNAKKKARKKKKAAAESAVTNELRNLAFSKPISAKAIQHAHQERHPLPEHNIERTVPIAIENVDPSWEEWKDRDEGYVVDQFQRDLDAALRLSAADVQSVQKNININSRNKKKNQKKQPAMSLDEFAATHLDEPSSLDQAPSMNTFPLPNGYCPDDLDPNHYEYDAALEETPHTIQHEIYPPTNKKHKKKKSKKNDNKAFADVLSELHAEEKSESVSLQPSSVDAASLASWQNDMEKKEKEIVDLQGLIQTLKDELSQVKKRNKQLCFILAQGEMKDKSEILIQVEELTNVKNELSDELSQMHSALEQERSKVSHLKVELAKQQGSRTKSKSTSE